MYATVVRRFYDCDKYFDGSYMQCVHIAPRCGAAGPTIVEAIAHRIPGRAHRGNLL